MRVQAWLCAGLLGMTLFFGCIGDGSAGSLSPEEARGKRIYFEGRSEAGRVITARVGRGGTPMPGKTFPCASCHASDGRGRPEGGVVPADITWSRLARPFSATLGTERGRSAYTGDLVGRAVTGGLNADGVMLDFTMPRFEMHQEDLRDLVAYLHRIEEDLDPGLTGRTLALGTIVPKGATPDALGPVVAGVLKSYVQDVNEQGGIYNRQLELTVLEAATREEAVEHATALTAQDRVFAVVSPVTAGIEQEIERLTDAHHVPLIGPLTPSPPSHEQIQRHTFYLLSGLVGEAQALLSLAGRSLSQEPVTLAVVYPKQEGLSPVVSAIRRHAQARHWPEPAELAYGPGTGQISGAVAQLKATQPAMLLFLGSDAELVTLAQAAVRAQWVPTVLMLSRSAGPAVFDLPADFGGRMFLAFSNTPDGPSPDKGAEFAAFRARHRLPAHHIAAQASAYAAAVVLTEGVKRAGIRLSRERLIGALEQLYEYQTGATPPLSYGPNRRVGSLGAQIMGVDVAQRRLYSVLPWIDLGHAAGGER